MTHTEHVWSIVTPEYPPGSGGVGDYTALVAERLARAGDRVHVWTPPNGTPARTSSAIRVRELPDRFGRGSARALDEDFGRETKDLVVLVQYVPHGFGMKAMNLPFAEWLGRRHERLWFMVHEPLYPFSRGQPLRHDLLAGATWLMLRLAARRAERLFVSTPAWESFLPHAVARSVPAEWLPIPATVTLEDDSARPALAPRPTVAHFGTYGDHLAGPLRAIFSALLRERPELQVRLVGRGSEAFAAELARAESGAASRVSATGDAETRVVLEELARAWVVLFPFIEGATARRTSLMTALAAGAAIVTTEGWCSESIWRESDAVELVPIGRPDAAVKAVLELLSNEQRRVELARRARELYSERFHVDRVVERLRALRS
jgi:glycosyltransferase involved in cell wall biosynthesis